MNTSVALLLVFLTVGFVLLIKGADFLVKGATALARKFSISELVIGLTIVAFGTSAPELIVSIVSSNQGYNEVVYGNVIGSNLFNLFFILGVCGCIHPIIVQKQTIWKEIPYSFFAIFLVLFLLNDQFLWGKQDFFSRIEATVLLLFFVAFLIYVFRSLKGEKPIVAPDTAVYSLPLMLLMIFGGLAGLVFGGRMVVNNAIELATIFHISDEIIGLTIIAAGTSLPELATSAVAAFRKNSDIAIGNVVGSNIFNLLFILPISGIITPMPYNSSLNVDLLILIIGSLLVFAAMFTGKAKKLERWEAALLLSGYIAYIIYLFIRT